MKTDLAILLHAPTGSDDQAIGEQLRSDGYRVRSFATLSDLADGCCEDAGLLVLTSEALADRPGRTHLRERLDHLRDAVQLPMILLTGKPVADSAPQAADAILGGSVSTVGLQRPTSRALLSATVEDCLRRRTTNPSGSRNFLDHPLAELLGFGLIHIDQPSERITDASPMALEVLDCTDIVDSTLVDGPLRILLDPVRRFWSGQPEIQATITHQGRQLTAFICQHRDRTAVLLMDEERAEPQFTQRFARHLVADDLAKLSHDLRAPVRQARLWQDLLQSSMDDQLSDEQREHFQRSAEALHRLSDMIERSLKPQLPQAQRCQVRDALDTTLELLQAEIEDNNAELVIDSPPDQAPLPQGDMLRLLQNLISNALRYRSERPPRITITGSDDGATVSLRISDNGIGIDSALLPHIFAKGRLGQQGDRRGGSGLGLAVCRDIVRKVGGRIWAESSIDAGTTFHIVLPWDGKQDDGSGGFSISG